MDANHVTKVASFEFLPPMLKQIDSYKPVGTNDPFEVSRSFSNKCHTSRQGWGSVSRNLPQ